MSAQRRKPPPRAPSNHTALVSIPTLNDIVTPATISVPPQPISKQKFLKLYSSTIKKTRVSSKRTRTDGNLSQEKDRGEGEIDEKHLKNPGTCEDINFQEKEKRLKSQQREASNLDTKLETLDQSGHLALDHSCQEWSMPTDTKVALEMMCAQFPKIQKASMRPFVLRSQLYSSVSDRTLVDRELEGLKLEKLVRVFKLSTGQDDYAIMFMTDYFAQIEAGQKRLASKYPRDEMAVFTWFVSYVMPSHLDAGITHSKLVSLLSEGGSVQDSHLSLLMNAGLLTRQLVDESAYWFSIPNAGFLLKSISSGRKEILSFMSRRKYREMLQVPLERRPLQYSMLGMRFHLRDLLGLGQIVVIPSPSGPLIRLTRDWLKNIMKIQILVHFSTGALLNLRIVGSVVSRALWQARYWHQPHHVLLWLAVRMIQD